MNKPTIDRRNFIKALGMGLGATGLFLTGCGSKHTSRGKLESSEADIPTGKMTYRTNPNSGDKVSLLGYGCMRWPTVPGKEEGQDELDQETINRLVDTAIAHGVNYFDTAPVYCKGRSEKATGTALRRHPRSSYFIATKMSNFNKATWSKEESVKIYRQSLENLQTDWIDYMLLHSIGSGKGGFDDFKARFVDNGILDFLLAEREAGRIRNLGFSFHGDPGAFEWCLDHHEKYHWDFAQIQLNYLDWNHANELNKSNLDGSYLLGRLKEKGIPAVIMEPLLGGRLANVPDHIAERLLAEEPDRSVASWAFRYCGTFPEVLTVLSGMTYMEHLEDNLRSYCPLKPLTEEEVQFLYDTADLMVKYPTVACNECQYCMPCPYGIDIPSIMAHYNKCVNQGNLAKDSQSPDYARARRAFLVGYDRSVPRLRQASHCIGCGQCSPHCPQNIDIPAQLHRIDDYVEGLKRNQA